MGKRQKTAFLGLYMSEGLKRDIASQAKLAKQSVSEYARSILETAVRGHVDAQLQKELDHLSQVSNEQFTNRAKLLIETYQVESQQAVDAALQLGLTLGRVAKEKAAAGE